MGHEEKKPPFDWHSIIQFDECMPADRKQQITKVLDDMASKPEGLEILKHIEDIYIGKLKGKKKVTISADDKIYASAAGSLINLNFDALKRGSYIDDKTGEIKPITLNRQLAHELAHTGDTVSDWSKFQQTEEYINAKKELDEINKALPKLQRLAEQAISEKNPDMKKFYEMEDRKTNLEYITEIDGKFKRTREAYALNLENAYMKTFEGEGVRNIYGMSKDLEFSHPLKDVIVMAGNDKLSDHYKIPLQKITKRDLMELAMGTWDNIDSHNALSLRATLYGPEKKFRLEDVDIDKLGGLNPLEKSILKDAQNRVITSKTIYD